MKPGAVRYVADIDDETGKIDYSLLVLRSSQMRAKFDGIPWYNGPRQVNYWIVKIKDLTWVKRSKAHGDWGWAKSIPGWARHSVLAEKPQPGRPTKRGALKQLLAETRAYKKQFGDEDPDYPDSLPYSMQIKKIERAIKRVA